MQIENKYKRTQKLVKLFMLTGHLQTKKAIIAYLSHHLIVHNCTACKLSDNVQYYLQVPSFVCFDLKLSKRSLKQYNIYNYNPFNNSTNIAPHLAITSLMKLPLKSSFHYYHHTIIILFVSSYHKTCEKATLSCNDKYIFLISVTSFRTFL